MSHFEGEGESGALSLGTFPSVTSRRAGIGMTALSLCQVMVEKGHIVSAFPVSERQSMKEKQLFS